MNFKNIPIKHKLIHIFSFIYAHIHMLSEVFTTCHCARKETETIHQHTGIKN